MFRWNSLAYFAHAWCGLIQSAITQLPYVFKRKKSDQRSVAVPSLSFWQVSHYDMICFLRFPKIFFAFLRGQKTNTHDMICFDILSSTFSGILFRTNIWCWGFYTYIGTWFLGILAYLLQQNMQQDMTICCWNIMIGIYAPH